VLVFAAGFVAALLWRNRAADVRPAAVVTPTPSRRAPVRPPAAGKPKKNPDRGDIAIVSDPAPARLAVLVDDLGNDSRALARVLAIREPLSGAVLPGLAHSAEAAEELSRGGKEVLLHLPFEPLSSRESPGPGLLKTSMGEREVAEVIARDLSEVPHAAGVNNHMGSKGTADARLMDAVMAVLRARGLYFLDSRTTEWTRAGEAARRHGVPFLSRNVFLDDVATDEAVSAQLRRAVETARTEGFSVAIGHPHSPTLEVLEREMPRLHAAGVRPVFVSDLLK
jgi:polysaccharide deacetylase 2 family uncharacterized protein YibQ